MKRRQYLAGIGAAGAAAVVGVPSVTADEHFEELETYDVDTGGEPYGPDQFTYPTGDEFYEGTWDIESVALYESDDRVRFEFTMAADIQNPFDLDPVSHQFVQIYINSPEADGPATDEGREGTNVTFESEYHTRVVAHGEDLTSVEDADGEEVSDDVEYELADDDTLAVEFPKDAVDWSDDVAFSATMTAFDGFGEGSLRAIEPDAGEYEIGGGSGDGNDPAVLDLLLPDGVSRADALAYDEDSPAGIPLVGLDDEDDEPGEEEENGEDDYDDEENGEDDPDDADDDVDENGEDDYDDENGEEDENGDDDPEDVDDEDDGLPGFGVGAAIAGLAGGALAGKRVLSDDDPEA